MNNHIQNFEVIQSDREALRAVSGAYFEANSPNAMLTALHLQFEGHAIELRCHDDDSLQISECTELRSEDGETKMSLSDGHTWTAAITKPILWVWSMVNQYGYFDGIQLHFASNAEDSGVLIQITAAGGALRVREI